MYRPTILVVLALSGALACRFEAPRPPFDSAAVTLVTVAPPPRGDSSPSPRPVSQSRPQTSGPSRNVSNTMGRIPILEYHLIGEKDGRWERHHASFRRDLELLHARGYRPVTVSQLVDGDFRLPEGLSPVVFTFDDASPSQFRYIERDGALEIDSTSALGVWLAFRRDHPDWENRAVFCLLSGAAEGRSFFGDRNIEGQKSAWRHRKIRFLAEQGFELCNHTLWHANLAHYSDAEVQEQIARGVMAIDSAVPGYRVRTFALPLGVWPKNRDLARAGEWRDPATGRVVRYDFDAILLVAGNPVRSPRDSAFNPLHLERVQVVEGTVERMLANLDRSGTRYVSDGRGPVVAASPARPRRVVGPQPK